jgi:hypothetical protein
MPGGLLFTQQKAATARGTRAMTAFYAHTLTTKEVMTTVHQNCLIRSY